MPKKKDSETFVFVKCPVCGKTFLPAPEHRFRVYGKNICSWHCYLKARENIRQYRTLDTKRR